MNRPLPASKLRTSTTCTAPAVDRRNDRLRPARPANRSEATGSAATEYRLPRRLDVHQVAQLLSDVATLADNSAVTLNGAEVEMIDLAGVRALGELLVGNVRLASPSVALRNTLIFTGHALLLSAVVPMNTTGKVA